MSQPNEPLPLWRTLTPMIVASGATPTTPKSLSAAATMPATWEPCQRIRRQSLVEVKPGHEGC